MEITLQGAPEPHGGSANHAWCSFVLTDTLTATERKRFLVGLNLIRPLGSELGALTTHQIVRNMAFVTLGTLMEWDPNLQVPGSNVLPLVTVKPRDGYVFGQNFVHVRLDSQGLTLDPHSPNPALVEHIALLHSHCQVVDHWSVSDPNLLSVEIPALKITGSGGVDKTFEGSLVRFTDRTDIDALGMILDAEPIIGGGSALTVVTLKDFLCHPAVLEALK